MEGLLSWASGRSESARDSPASASESPAPTLQCRGEWPPRRSLYPPSWDPRPRSVPVSPLPDGPWDPQRRAPPAAFLRHESRPRPRRALRGPPSHPASQPLTASHRLHLMSNLHPPTPILKGSEPQIWGPRLALNTHGGTCQKCRKAERRAARPLREAAQEVGLGGASICISHRDETSETTGKSLRGEG